MTAEKMLKVRLPAAFHESLAGLAQATGRSKRFLAVQALTTWIEADRGEFAAPDEVDKFFQTYGA
jgi:predicted transcriptional regulator